MDIDICINKDVVFKMIKKINKVNFVKMYFEDFIVCLFCLEFIYLKIDYNRNLIFEFTVGFCEDYKYF